MRNHDDHRFGCCEVCFLLPFRFFSFFRLVVLMIYGNVQMKDDDDGGGGGGDLVKNVFDWRLQHDACKPISNDFVVFLFLVEFLSFWWKKWVFSLAFLRFAKLMKNEDD